MVVIDNDTPEDIINHVIYTGDLSLLTSADDGVKVNPEQMALALANGYFRNMRVHMGEEGDLYVFTDRWLGGREAEQAIARALRLDYHELTQSSYLAKHMEGRRQFEWYFREIMALLRANATSRRWTPVEGVRIGKHLLRWDMHPDSHIFFPVLKEYEGEPTTFMVDMDAAPLIDRALRDGPSAVLPPRAREALRSWVDGKWYLLLELLGYPSIPRYIWNYATMLVGGGSNGKSTYLRLLEDLYSPHVVHIGLQLLSDSSQRFAVATLRNALVNVYADLPRAPLTDSGRFKVLTGGDAITADRKFREPVSFVNGAKLFFSTNELPETHDYSFAFWRRWIVIEFPHEFPRDSTYYDRTFPEDDRPAVLAAAVAAFARALRRGNFAGVGTAQDYQEIWKRRTDSVYAFVMEMLESGRYIRDPRGEVDLSAIYGDYVSYINTSDVFSKPFAKNWFVAHLAEMGFQRRHSGENRFIQGLRRVSGMREADTNPGPSARPRGGRPP
jgi:P4 family phage/plasmid primase-like protien